MQFRPVHVPIGVGQSVQERGKEMIAWVFCGGWGSFLRVRISRSSCGMYTPVRPSGPCCSHACLCETRRGKWTLACRMWLCAIVSRCWPVDEDVSLNHRCFGVGLDIWGAGRPRGPSMSRGAFSAGLSRVLGAGLLDGVRMGREHVVYHRCSAVGWVQSSTVCVRTARIAWGTGSRVSWWSGW